MSEAGKMWGGRFKGELDPDFAEFQQSLPIDHQLAFADLEVNRHWSRALQQCGVLTQQEVVRIEQALDELEDAWNDHGVPLDGGAEDVHSLVEKELQQKIGDLAKRIHTGRSRNDQVATDLRLYLRERIHGCVGGVQDLLSELVRKAEHHASAPMPGYTHLQRAQPITIGHHALAHAEALGRDRMRFLQAWQRMDQCPLGSGALAGTPLAIDRDALAAGLDFLGGPTHNSLDATSARDHACELAFCCAMTMAHVSRLCEDYIFFATREAGFLHFGDKVSTGSSLMPQKRNPDAMELLRGKTGRMFGFLQALLCTVKALPMAYNRDLQEDKASLFPALMMTENCLLIATVAVADAHFDVDRCAKEAELGYLNATDLADLLVQNGVPFRDAHHQVGAAVNRAVELGVELQDLPADEQKRLLPQLQGDLKAQLSATAVLARRDVIGGTAPRRVQQEIARWHQEFESWEAAEDEAGDD